MNPPEVAPTIIVVDDEAEVLAAIADTLEDDFRVLTEESPHLAFEILAREKGLSVIISDQRMPELSGHEFLCKAREISDAARILITGYSDLDAVIAAVNTGRIFGYISKPWDPVKLRQLIRQAAEHCELMRALSHEQRLLHNLLDNMPDAIYFKDRQHRFLRSNRVYASSLGLTDPKEAVGKTARDFLQAEAAEALEAEDDRVLTTGTPTTDTLAMPVEPAGRPVWLSTTRAPIRDEQGEVAGLVAIARDVSDTKEKEERLQAALAEKNLLLGEIHHRVKNNLQVVSSLLDLQSDRVDNPAVLELLRDSCNRVRSMAMIHQALYELGGFAEVDFAGFLDTLVPTLFESYGTDPSRITLAIDASGVQLPIKMAIPCGLLVNELIANALKHAFPDGRSGEIKVKLAKEADHQVRLSVSDDGAGLPEGTDLEQAGTLGLQLVGLLAEQLGATMTVERAQPTRFTLRFPVQQ